MFDNSSEEKENYLRRQFYATPIPSTYSQILKNLKLITSLINNY